MCVTPVEVIFPKGPALKKTEVPCGHCWACRKNRVNDLVGRCLCETATSEWSLFVTLTYDPRKVVSRYQTETIIKPDFQNFIKLLRKGHDTRYLAAGEYGEKKGRTHFHAILMGQGIPPEISEYWNGKPALKAWRWGHVDVQPVHENTIRYVAKYLVKAKNKKIKETTGREWITYSKQPLLGAKYIIDKAERQAEMRVFPQTFNYQPPGGDTKNRYSFYGKAQFVFFDALLTAWPEAAAKPKTEWMENAFVRYKKHLQNEAWRKLSPSEQSKELNKSFTMSEKSETKMTTSEQMRQGYERYDRLLAEQGEHLKWLDAVKPIMSQIVRQRAGKLRRQINRHE